MRNIKLPGTNYISIAVFSLLTAFFVAILNILAVRAVPVGKDKAPSVIFDVDNFRATLIGDEEKSMVGDAMLTEDQKVSLSNVDSIKTANQTTGPIEIYFEKLSLEAEPDVGSSMSDKNLIENITGGIPTNSLKFGYKSDLSRLKFCDKFETNSDCKLKIRNINSSLSTDVLITNRKLSESDYELSTIQLNSGSNTSNGIQAQGEVKVSFVGL